MKQELIAALDAGTTNTKALLVNRNGEPVFRGSRPVPLLTPQPGFVEQDPLVIWESAAALLRECVRFAEDSGSIIAGIALTNQRETGLAWRRDTGLPLAPAVSWQCRRSVPTCARLSGEAATIRQRTGLPLDPLATAGKWTWMMEHLAGVQEAASTGDLCLGTVDTWLLSRLTSGEVHATDPSNASRTGLMDLASVGWDPGLADMFGVPTEALPKLCASASTFGSCRALPELDGVPIVAAIGDSHAALAGHGAFAPGTVKATYGTGSSLMTLTTSLVEDTPRLARTVAWTLPAATLREGTQFALEGNITMTGSGVEWVGRFLGLAAPLADTVRLAQSVPDAAGAYFVPAMVGLGAPTWDTEARGVLCGLDRTHTAAHMARASVDAIAYQVADVLHVMRDLVPSTISALRADGGATHNDRLMQFQSDLLGMPVLRSQREELSALGAAYLGGLTLGWWPDLASIAGAGAADVFQPAPERTSLSKSYVGWRTAVGRACLKSEGTI